MVSYSLGCRPPTSLRTHRVHTLSEGEVQLAVCWWLVLVTTVSTCDVNAGRSTVARRGTMTGMYACHCVFVHLSEQLLDSFSYQS
jgi:hypothetical protein